MPSMQWTLDQEIKKAKNGISLDQIKDVPGFSWNDIFEISSPLSHQWSDYVFNFADWNSFITLTFERELSRDVVYSYWRSLIQNLNTDLFGNHYTRIVGHSYFAYCLAFEKQQRGAYHLHALISGRLNFKMIHDFWNHVAGFAWITSAKDKKAVSIYVSKYVVKEGDLLLYRPLKQKIPAFQPLWYLGS